MQRAGGSGCKEVAVRGREEKGKEGAEPGSRAGSRRGRNLSVQPARGERRPPRRRQRRRGRAGGGSNACSWVAARGAAWRWRAARGDAGLGAGLLNPLRSTAGLELGGGASAPRTQCPKGPHSKLLQTEASRLPGPNTSWCPFAAATLGVPKAPARSAPPGSPHPPTQLLRTATAGPRQTPPGSRLHRT